jgi:very-short-patch-repair endonuclease
MAEPFIGSEAVANGDVLKSALRTHYTKLFRDVYLSPGAELTPLVRARAGWLWSRRRGIVAGLSASALHGARWVDVTAPLEILHSNRNPLPGLRVRGNRIEDDEVALIDGVPVTTPARTALDLGCWYPTGEAVAAIDDLLRASDLKVAEVEALVQRYPGRRGIHLARNAIGLADPGAQSPKESWLRLLLIRVALPRPQTQIPVQDEFGDVIAYLDMGWENLKVGVEYDGEQHRSDRRQYGWDIRRLEMLERLGWIVIRVVAGDRPAEIISRVRAALARRASR